MASDAAAMRAVLIGLILLPTAALAQEPPPVKLTLACEQAAALRFRLTFQNISPTPTAAVIGAILGNDRQYVLGDVTLTVRRAGTNMNYSYVQPPVAGRVDLWFALLPADASYSVVAPAGKFARNERPERDPFDSPADVRVTLKTRSNSGDLNGDLAGQKFIRTWVGTVVSDWIHFPADCSR
jgi:hypothetical protein